MTYLRFSKDCCGQLWKQRAAGGSVTSHIRDGSDLGLGREGMGYRFRSWWEILRGGGAGEGGGGRL